MTTLRKLRQAAGLTQTRLSELSGIDQGQISRMENEGCKRYSLAVIRLGLALNCRPEDLLEGADSGRSASAAAAVEGATHAA